MPGCGPEPGLVFLLLGSLALAATPGPTTSPAPLTLAEATQLQQLLKAAETATPVKPTDLKVLASQMCACLCAGAGYCPCRGTGCPPGKESCAYMSTNCSNDDGVASVRPLLKLTPGELAWMFANRKGTCPAFTAAKQAIQKAKLSAD